MARKPYQNTSECCGWTDSFALTNCGVSAGRGMYNSPDLFDARKETHIFKNR